MSLFHPPAGFPPHLAYFWPLIWCQVLLLRAAVRATFGRGVQYHWSVSPNGRVFLTSIDWLPSQKVDRAWLKPPAQSCDRLAAACDGRAFAPAYASEFASAPESGDLRSPHSRSAPSRGRNLPLPET